MGILGSAFRGLFRALFGSSPSIVPHPIAVEVAPPEPWQDRVRRLQLPIDERIPVAVPGQPPVRRDEAPTDGDYVAALTQDGLAHGTPEAVAFLRSAIGHLPAPKGIDLRRHGVALPPDELRALGMRANANLTRSFYDILTEKGRIYPLDSAQFIVSALMSRLSAKRQIRSTADAGLEWVKVYPNNTAAGPCKACIALSRKSVPLAEAPLGPLTDCPHPSQCSLIFRALLSKDSEF